MIPILFRRQCLSRASISCKTRSYHASTTTFGWFSRVTDALGSIVRGDEHKSPVKRLERKYIYYALLTMQYRKLRLENKLAPGVFDDDLYERATDELDGQEIDKMRIMELRRLLQSMLEPQMNEIFDVFQKVDERLQIPVENVANMDFQRLEYKQILMDEFLKTGEQIKDLTDSGSCDAKSRSMDFLMRKKSAIETLLSFHGWNECVDPKLVNSHNNDEMVIDDFGTNVRKTSSKTLDLIRRHQTINLCRSALIREEIGYSVISLRSLIPGGGRGLFLDGHIMSGTMVAFQPGDVWPKEHFVADAPELDGYFDHDPDFNISLRFDEYLVDSRQSPVTVLSQVGSMNPWALGHMANHPPKGIVPNCLSIMINFIDGGKIDNIIKYTPNTYARPPTWKSKFFDAHIPVLMHGVCLLSRRDLCNEELLYDYRLQARETPEWYNVVKYQDGFDEDQLIFLGNKQNQMSRPKNSRT